MEEYIYAVVEHTGSGYIVRHVFKEEEKANSMKAFLQGMIPSIIWDVKSFQVLHSITDVTNI